MTQRGNDDNYLRLPEFPQRKIMRNAFERTLASKRRIEVQMIANSVDIANSSSLLLSESKMLGGFKIKARREASELEN